MIDINISLIIPIYNVERYLIKCLDSVVNQSMPFDEVILINDGSSDRSQLICEQYVTKCRYFRLINQRNKGLSAARNAGLSYAVSEYVMFLDSDDYLRLDTVKKLKMELSIFKHDAIYFDSDIQCENEFVVKRNIYDRSITELNRVRMSGQYFFLRCYPDNYVVSACMAVYKKNTIEDMKLRFPEGLYYEDNYFTFVFMNQAQCVTYISEKLYVRRYRKNSITTGLYSEKKFIDSIKIMLLIWEEIFQKEILYPLEENGKFLRYVNNYCRLALNNYCLCKDQDIVIGRGAEVCFSRMADMYELMLKQYHLGDNIKSLTNLNLMSENLKRVIVCYPERKKRLDKILKKIIEKQKSFYEKLLRNLPLNVESCKIGIYGTGNHTKGLLAIYEHMIGKITCNLVFLDSYGGNRTYLNREVIQYQQLDESFNIIVISSFLHKQEMIENVRKINKEISIYDFYTEIDEDIFSWISDNLS